MPKNTKRKNKNPESGKHIYTGRLEVTRSGMGFVVVDGLETDIIIDRNNMDTALNGDEVKVEVRANNEPGKRLKELLLK